MVISGGASILHAYARLVGAETTTELAATVPVGELNTTCADCIGIDVPMVT